MKTIMMVILLIFNSHMIYSEADANIVLTFKDEYNKNYNFINKSIRSGFRTIDEINKLGNLVDAIGSISVDGQGFFRVRDYITGKYYFTRTGFIEIGKISFVNENYCVYNLDFKIYEIKNEMDLNYDTMVEDLQFSIWEPIGEINTIDGLYFEFENYKKASGKVVVNKLETPVGTIKKYLNEMRLLINEMYDYEVIDSKKREGYIQNIEVLEGNYSTWIDDIFYFKNYFAQDYLASIILSLAFFD